MKLSKGQGVSLFTAIIVFGIFNIVVFLAPLAHTVVFWLGYFFALFALTTICLTTSLYFGKPVKEDKFLNLPAVKVAWTYFVLQTALSVWEMIAFPFSYLLALTINLVLGAIFAVIILAIYAAAGKIDKVEQFTAEKVLFIKQLKLRIDSIDTNDVELSKKIKDLAEDVRYSDPMSHSKLADIEETLAEVVDELADNINDIDKALELCKQASKLLKNRNEQCKMYKGVKDTVAVQAKRSDNGLGIAFAGMCATLGLFLITLTVCFIIVPQTKYNDASALLKAEKYNEAIVAFTDLGNYKDSEEKIEEIKTILLDKDYDAALALLNAEKYNKAIEAFTKLGDHRDSKAKVEEIKTLLLDNQYNDAENLFKDGKYTEALEIYKKLNGYKNAVSRIEEIKNRLSTGKIVYFGTFNGEPIAWRIVKTENNKLLLLADKPIKQLPIHSEIKDVEFRGSTLNTWLNEEFIKSFSEEQVAKIIVMNNQKVFLPDEKMVGELKNDGFNLSADSDWWIAEKSESGFKYVDKNGNVVKAGDLTIRDKGVRPAIWIDLE